jgi:hypothetical protein
VVKLGFIVEGATEKIILEKSDFFLYLDSLSIEYVPEVTNVGGNGNLLPRNIGAFTSTLESKGANKIFILTDLDKEQCITITKNRIAPSDQHIVTISVKQIEAWFLSDTNAMCNLLNDPAFVCDNPEEIDNPFEEIKSIRLSKIGKGVPTKIILANTMVHKNKFSIIKAAEHANCSSAKYFLNKISEAVA